MSSPQGVQGGRAGRAEESEKMTHSSENSLFQTSGQAAAGGRPGAGVLPELQRPGRGPEIPGG